MSKTNMMSLLAGAAVSFGAVSAAAANTSADEVRSIVAEMMADANNRSSLLQSGGSAGYDGGFVISDASGDNKLKINGQIQFRYVANFTDDEDNDDDYEGGFQTRRTKMTFKGNVIDPNLYYTIKWETSRSGGNITLQDAYAGYKFDNGAYLQWGQFRPKFIRERSVSSSRQLAVERSATANLFGQTEAQGFEFGYKAEDWNFALAITDGIRSANSDFDDNNGPFVVAGDDGLGGTTLSIIDPYQDGPEADFSIAGRFEYKFAGGWRQFRDFTSMPGSDYAAMLGAGFVYEYTDSDNFGDDTDSDNFGDDIDDLTVFGWTVDLSIEGDGWNFFAAGMGSHSEQDNLRFDFADPTVRNDADIDLFGVVVQGGIFIPETDWEIFARWDGIFLDDDDFGDDVEDNFNFITFGTNWYWSGHAAKFTLDAIILLDDPAEFPLDVTSSGAGLLDSGGDDQFAIRAQFQLLF